MQISSHYPLKPVDLSPTHSIFLVPAAFPFTPPPTLALRLPNCIALLTLLAVPSNPALSAAILNSILSPHPSPDS